ncbi:MAG: hypothetical protein MK098_12690 [Marinovum sp.]|nr:hypothetical protein [Marinovum sp.]
MNEHEVIPGWVIEKQNDESFIFYCIDAESSVEVAKAWTKDEFQAASIAAKIHSHGEMMWRRGERAGRTYLADDLRRLLNAAPLELE